MAVVEAHDLRRVYKTHTGTIRRRVKEIEAVKGVTFEIEKGELFGLLGPNGAGKTTTIKMLITLLIPTSGSARVLGLDVVKDAAAKPKMRYSAGIVIHDHKDVQKILYRSARPILTPEDESELHGIVDNVVFPTGIDPRPDLGPRVFDFYYGMADWSIGAGRLTLTA